MQFVHRDLQLLLSAAYLRLRDTHELLGCQSIVEGLLCLQGDLETLIRVAGIRGLRRSRRVTIALQPSESVKQIEIKAEPSVVRVSSGLRGEAVYDRR